MWGANKPIQTETIFFIWKKTCDLHSASTVEYRVKYGFVAAVHWPQLLQFKVTKQCLAAMCYHAGTSRAQTGQPNKHRARGRCRPAAASLNPAWLSGWTEDTRQFYYQQDCIQYFDLG
jgi:hypothetical protein